MSTTIKVKVNQRWYIVEVGDLNEFPIRAVVDGEVVEVEMRDLPSSSSPEAQAADLPSRPQPSGRPAPQAAPPDTPTRSFKTPMPGVIVSVAVQVGDQVVTGDPICILEAMKMQQTLRADWSGVVRSVYVTSGDQVVDGQTIADLE